MNCNEMKKIVVFYLFLYSNKNSCFLVKTASGKDFLLSAPSLLDRSDWFDELFI